MSDFPLLDAYTEAPNYHSATFPEPRDFQRSAHEALRDGARAGHRCQLLVAPTGGGKTFLGLQVAHQTLLKGRRAIFVCDRSALINQTSATADRYGLSAHGVVQANHPRRDTRMPFQIASIQTIAKRGYWPAADVIIIDEAHTQHKAWTEHIQNTTAKVIGLSATPCSKGLGRLFSNLINAGTMDRLTKDGVLVPMRILICEAPDMAGAATAGGEWTDKAAEERLAGIIGDVVTEWRTRAADRKTIIFGASIAYCEELAAKFNAVGVNAAVYTSDTSATDRDEMLREYRKPDSRLRILISVEALAKGFDVPDVSCVVDCRPLRKSLSTAIQMWGRGLRASRDTGKRDCLLLDHSGNFNRFMADFEDVFHNGFTSLDMGEKLDKDVRQEPKELKGCPQCGHKPFAKRCISCGFEIVKAAMVEEAPGVMRELALEAKASQADKFGVYQQICSYVRGRGNPETAKGRAYYLYNDLVGCYPPNTWNFEETPGAPILREVMNKITHRMIRYSKRQHDVGGDGIS